MSNVSFGDHNFRLACLDILFAQGHFASELEQILAIPVDHDEYVPNKARLRAIARLPVSQALLDSITEFAPDGGDDVYFHVFPNWGGTDVELYIKSFADVKLLRNLRSLWVNAVARESSLDLCDIVSLKKLQEVSTDWFYVAGSMNCENLIEALTSRGVSISITGRPCAG